jgi:hypothetical protein
MDRKTASTKMVKSLRLARSTEPHEAAAALRQAQALMREHSIDEHELDGETVHESWVKSSASSRPARFEVRLASVIAGAFGCEIVFTRRPNRSRTQIVGGYAFIGVASAEQGAAYAFTVLARQLRAARAGYVASTLRRCNPRNRVARADQFCEGWVSAACKLVNPVGVATEDERRLLTYMRAHYADTRAMVPRTREIAWHVDATRDRLNGYVDGSGAVLNRGLQSGPAPLAIGAAGVPGSPG